MAKKLELTPKIRELISTATNGSVDPESVSVYETISINSLPVNKNNLFEGAVHTGQTLREMASAVSQRPLTSHVPVHTMHQQSYELPVGKTFHAEVFNTDTGVEELRSLFYIDNTKTELISGLETNSIEEVSVGVRYKALNCSSCGWDYLSAEATFDNIYDRVCANDHQIGTNGVHLRLNGLDRWMEQSLVSLGAANGAKIQARTQSLLGKDVYTQLAATGARPELTTLYATATKPKDEEMDLKELIEKVTAQAVQLSEKDTEIAKLKLSADKVPDLEKKVGTLEAEVTSLKEGDPVKSKEQAELGLAFARKEAVRLAAALGETPPAETADFATLTASIEANRIKAADRFPTGGRSEKIGGSGEDDTKKNRPPSAFKFSK